VLAAHSIQQVNFELSWLLPHFPLEAGLPDGRIGHVAAFVLQEGQQVGMFAREDSAAFYCCANNLGA
jgi:hypothetical protein